MTRPKKQINNLAGSNQHSTQRRRQSCITETSDTSVIACNPGNHTSLCEGGKWTAQELTWGGHYDNWDFDNTQYVLNFGSNVFESHTNHISTAQRLIRAMVDRGVRLVTFDVRLSNTAAKSTEWVPVRPGTDQAVVLAMCHVIMTEGLYETGMPFLDFCKVATNAGEHFIEIGLVNALVVAPIVKLRKKFFFAVFCNLHLIKRLHNEFPGTTSSTR